VASPTPNKGYTYPAHGGAVNTWDTPLNTDFDFIDLNVGGSYNITITSTATTATYASSVATLSSTVATATLPSSLAQNMYYYVSGALTRNLTVAFPAVGGFYNINNQTTGAFSVTANTVAVGSSGTVISQGEKLGVVADTVNVYAQTTAVSAKIYTQLGDPNSNVAGRVGASNGQFTDAVYDATDKQLYLCTTTGVSSAAVWTPQISRVFPQGILTVRNNTTFPIPIANTASVSTVFYTPYVGSWTVLSDGTNLYPYQFTRFTLSLVAGHAANNIYDVFMYANPTAGIIAPVIGTGPTWTGGAGGSVTPGTCARGTGAGSTDLTSLNGVLVNNVQVTLTNGVNTYTCPASQGIYLGSIWIDSAAGNTTCNMGAGQARKWGVWNYYNRYPIMLAGRDGTVSWTYGTNTYRASNADSTNNASAFCGVDEDQLRADFTQLITSGDTAVGSIAIGENSTTVASAGLVGSFRADTTVNTGANVTATLITAPKLGIWRFNCLEKATGTFTYNGGTDMQLTVQYRG